MNRPIRIGTVEDLTIKDVGGHVVSSGGCGTLYVQPPKRPVWQRCRVLPAAYIPSHWIGREIWCRGAARYRTARCVTDGSLERERAYETNLIGEDGSITALPAVDVELLARGPEDFAEHVERQSLATFLAEGRS